MKFKRGDNVWFSKNFRCIGPYTFELYSQTGAVHVQECTWFYDPEFKTKRDCLLSIKKELEDKLKDINQELEINTDRKTQSSTSMEDIG